MKKLIQKPFVKNILAPLFRGAVKQIPFVGTPLVEIVSNMTLPDGVPKKHSNLSMIIQATIAGIIILDIILNKGANLKALLDSVGVLGLMR